MQEPARSPHWPIVRKAHLTRQPVCQGCGGTKKLEAHHIKPFHLFPALELVDENLITLCEQPGHDCHFHLGHLLNWSCWNPIVVEDAKEFLTKLHARRSA